QPRSPDWTGLTQQSVLYLAFNAFDKITTVRTLIMLATVSRIVNKAAARMQIHRAFQEAAMETDGQQEFSPAGLNSLARGP
ncbi:uncharacterized, partial [Tachysurus ichikawai]